MKKYLVIDGIKTKSRVFVGDFIIYNISIVTKIRKTDTWLTMAELQEDGYQ